MSFAMPSNACLVGGSRYPLLQTIAPERSDWMKMRGGAESLTSTNCGD
jgi:hypothetical protein